MSGLDIERLILAAGPLGYIENALVFAYKVPG